jgi:hypothetical protein
VTTTRGGRSASPSWTVNPVADEVWRDVVGYEGVYQVSSLGRVRSVDRYLVTARGFRRFYPGQLLRTNPDTAGYLMCTLSVNGVTSQPKVHRLVASAFIGPLPNGLETRHLNGNRLDNRPENLQYGTRSQNANDAVRHGTHNHARKTHCSRGHDLIPVNLVPSQLHRGRSCLACAKAVEHHQRHPEADIQAVSDWQYEQIVARGCVVIDPKLCHRQLHPRDAANGRKYRGRWVCRPCCNYRRDRLKEQKRIRQLNGEGQ